MTTLGIYKEFQVGFFGDNAGVRFEYTTPKIIRSSKPTDDKMRRDWFDSVCSHVIIFPDELAKQIGEAVERGDYADAVFMGRASTKLAEFIEQNGATNPAETIDWIGVDYYIPALTK